MTLGTLIQRILNHWGYEVRRVRQSSKALPIHLLSLVVDDWMRRKASRGDEGFCFVQIGANDGVAFDPMRAFVLRHHWRGVLVEPQPAAFARLVENYRDEPQLAFENAAIAERDGVVPFFAPKAQPGLPDMTLAGSFDRAAVERISRRRYGTDVEELTVPALTVRTLLEKHQLRSLDLVQSDAEGFDDRIVAMFVESGVLPAIFHFETASLPPDRLRACLDLLAHHGYRVATLGLDTVAYRQPITQAGAGGDAGSDSARLHHLHAYEALLTVPTRP